MISTLLNLFILAYKILTGRDLSPEYFNVGEKLLEINSLKNTKHVEKISRKNTKHSSSQFYY